MKLKLGFKFGKDMSPNLNYYNHHQAPLGAKNNLMRISKKKKPRKIANCRNQSSKQTLKNYKLGINHVSYFSSVHSNLITQNMRLQSHTLGINSPNTK